MLECGNRVSNLEGVQIPTLRFHVFQPIHVVSNSTIEDSNISEMICFRSFWKSSFMKINLQNPKIHQLKKTLDVDFPNSTGILY